MCHKCHKCGTKCGTILFSTNHALLQEQWSDKEGARTWKGMEEMDGISYQGGGDERMCKEIEESKRKVHF